MNRTFTHAAETYTVRTEYGTHALYAPNGTRLVVLTCQRKGQDAYGKPRFWWAWPGTTAQHWPTAEQAARAWLTAQEQAA